MKAILVSIIIPCFNRAHFLEASILSVLKEREYYPNFELIIIDGGSTDGTVEILKKYDGEIAYWISEPDRGAAEAFNKGIQKAKGEIIRYFGSDDIFLNGHLTKVVEMFSREPHWDVIGAHEQWVSVDDKGNKSPQGHNYKPGAMTLPEVITWANGGVFSAVETWHFRKTVFEKCGLWDPQVLAVPDYEFALRIAKAGMQILILPDVFIEKTMHSSSNGSIYKQRIQGDLRKTLAKHFGWKIAFQTFPPNFLQKTYRKIRPILGHIRRQFF